MLSKICYHQVEMLLQYPIKDRRQTKISHVWKLRTEILLLPWGELVGTAVTHQTTAEQQQFPWGLTHIPSSDYGYLQSYCQTCWYLQYQTLMLIQTDSSLPCKRGKALLRPARPSSIPRVSDRSHYTSTPLTPPGRHPGIDEYTKFI